jgi:hypothetical protein
MRIRLHRTRLPFWTKVRDADIRKDLRDTFELLGEDVVATSIGTHTYTLNTSGAASAALEWLRERRDEQELRQDRLETVEWILLVLGIIGVIAIIPTVVNEIRSLVSWVLASYHH